MMILDLDKLQLQILPIRREDESAHGAVLIAHILSFMSIYYFFPNFGNGLCCVDFLEHCPFQIELFNIESLTNSVVLSKSKRRKTGSLFIMMAVK